MNFFKLQGPAERLKFFLIENRAESHHFLHELCKREQPFLLRTEIHDIFDQVIKESQSQKLATSPFKDIIHGCQEAAVRHPWIYLAVRKRVARWIYLRINLDNLSLETISPDNFLKFKEWLVLGDKTDEWPLEIDFEPFSREFFKLQEPRSIGKGVEFLNRRLSSGLFEALERGDDKLLRFLQVHSYRNQQLMLNREIESTRQLRDSLRTALNCLRKKDDAASWIEIQADLRELGFEPGWGDCTARVRDTMGLLLDILEAPSPGTMELFLGRIPMIFSIAIITPHGYFGQSKVLGRPDTGGQVVYILDQVKALELEMRSRLQNQGLDIDPQIIVLTRLIPESEGTTCNQRTERIAGTTSSYILRVPFRTSGGEIIPHWISRFEIWPYLERFSEDSSKELLAELDGRPDLIIGNYSDGNLVASLMAQKLGVTQCNIAHALEKAKYLYSDLYWQQNDDHYHFSCQFTADIIAMNSADFIVTSTYQEIAGTEENPGQYESYKTYTMPNLYRVIHGIDAYDPKFNIISPGADPDIYFPATEKELRFSHLHQDIESLVFGPPINDNSRGILQKRHKPIILTIARLDRIKNLTGLVRLFAKNKELREFANLLVIGGHVNPQHSSDVEEIEQIHLMHQLFDEFNLDKEVRWLGIHLDKQIAGELYRYVADQRGIFVQPALFEAFGLTVIEAMGSGLPTFATCFGGPMEIIKHGISGFHIDPNHEDSIADSLLDFFKRCAEEPEYWNRIAQGGLERVNAKYTWKLYAKRMMTYARIYGFWRYVSDLERRETKRYLEMFYSLQFRPLANQLESQS